MGHYETLSIFSAELAMPSERTIYSQAKCGVKAKEGISQAYIGGDNCDPLLEGQ